MKNCLEKQANKGICCELISLTSQREGKKKCTRIIEFIIKKRKPKPKNFA